MKPFVPKPVEKDRVIYSFALSVSMDKKLQEIGDAAGIAKQELIRQMIGHCLKTIEFDPSKEKKHEREDF